MRNACIASEIQSPQRDGGHGGRTLQSDGTGGAFRKLHAGNVAVHLKKQMVWLEQDMNGTAVSVQPAPRQLHQLRAGGVAH
eukprot:CAMPEP_0174365766 /NCGR_PEP_ID=MMETSP0811_2-20130205/78438_1 /TAXON_ID=73025 ORGANISM="Eutreptiella gymnastica-like, Strain CCMP1594" /NCGR_SAMPLE_ID=MMETSP0811_2 /ASSEMBLY_ACC=CAM_ASM_000667 /LENGTH=80 /DNA_ID=CAMNT_0015506689 /DNA_START=493 /DNA_END=735 /DNA_ORIENTATION=-